MAADTHALLDSAAAVTVHVYDSARGGRQAVTLDAGWSASESGIAGTDEEDVDCFFPWRNVSELRGTL